MNRVELPRGGLSSPPFLFSDNPSPGHFASAAHTRSLGWMKSYWLTARDNSLATRYNSDTPAN
jgi:hypothetical protein